MGLPYEEDLLVRIKLRLKPDGTVLRSEILDHARMNIPGQECYKVVAENALRAVRICQPLRGPPTGYDRWKDLQLNFNANEMVTHGLPAATLGAAVPTPESTKAAIKPP